MLRSLVIKSFSTAKYASNKANVMKQSSVFSIHKANYSLDAPLDAEDQSYIKAFESKNTSAFEIRMILTRLQGEDIIPHPKVVDAVMRACRRVNDFALAVRTLESLKWKAKGDPATYKGIVEKIRPTLTELGISTPEELGYDKPEKYLEDVFDIH